MVSPIKINYYFLQGATEKNNYLNGCKGRYQYQ